MKRMVYATKVLFTLVYTVLEISLKLVASHKKLVQ
ncbi:Uncharacterised protein [Mycobacteroides abscessus]|nr:Uncharacterised protein [Mycobacteroides abscessus]